MYLVRFVAFSAGLTLAPLACPASLLHNAEYLGGTVKTIPAKVEGTLDLKDSKELRFEFGRSTYRMAFSQIQDYKLSDAQSSPRKIAHVPVPVLGGRPQVLNISFRDASGNAGSMSFRVSARVGLGAERLLLQRTHRPENLEAAKQSESWWGDGYWKTNRNKNSWPEAQAGTVAAGGGGSR